MGKAKNDSRSTSKAEQLAIRRQRRGNSDPADWGSVDSVVLLRAVATVTKHGYGLTLGYTRDGAAYTVRVLGDDSFATEYVRPTEDIELYLRNLAEDFDSIQ